MGHTLVAVVTATNPDGSVPASSNPTPVITVPAPRWKALPLISADPVASATPSPSPPACLDRPERGHRCVAHRACTELVRTDRRRRLQSYAIADADLGAVLRVQEIASNAGGSIVVWSARYVGPIISNAAGTSVLKPERDPSPSRTPTGQHSPSPACRHQTASGAGP